MGDMFEDMEHDGFFDTCTQCGKNPVLMDFKSRIESCDECNKNLCGYCACEHLKYEEQAE